MISAENDPLQLRPNPENLISKVRAEYRGHFNAPFYLGGAVYLKLTLLIECITLKTKLYYSFLGHDSFQTFNININ